MRQAVLCLAALGMAGCASIGPGKVTRDRFVTRGLYLDVPAWGYHVFEVSRQS